MTLTRDKLVERIAREKAKRSGKESHWRAYAHGIRRTLDEIAALGLCIVPREPTEAMSRAGEEEMHGKFGTHDDAYRAMIAAAGEG